MVTAGADSAAVDEETGKETGREIGVELARGVELADEEGVTATFTAADVEGVPRSIWRPRVALRIAFP